MNMKKNLLLKVYAVALVAILFGAGVALASYGFTDVGASTTDPPNPAYSYLTSASPVASLSATPAVFSSTYGDSLSNLCESAASNAGLSTAAQYWCVGQANWNPGSITTCGFIDPSN